MYDRVDSTNKLVRERALKGEAEGLVVVADDQTSGRGRGNHSFFSSGGSGVYMSMLLRPILPPSQCTLITLAAAVAAAEALNSVLVAFSENDDVKDKRAVGIKWINDLFIGRKKTGGILAQSASCGGKTDYVVLGIGINVYDPPDGFPDEIKDIADSLFGDRRFRFGARNRVIAGVIKNFMSCYKDIAERTFIDEYRRLCIVIGQYVRVLPYFGEEFGARVSDVTSDGEILIQRDGDTKTGVFRDGEISIKIDG